MRNKLFVLIALIVATFLFSCAEKGDVEAADIIVCGTFDPETHICDKRDGNLYKIKRMPDGKFWMTENLKYESFSSKCYNENSAYCDKYGRLYSWSEKDGLCPEGWRVPDMTANWELLSNEVDDQNLKAKYDWDAYGNIDGNGTDPHGFAALPGGAYGVKSVNKDETCKDVDELLQWDGLGKLAVFMSSTSASVWMITNDPEAKFCVHSEKSLISVRCIKE